MECKLPDTSVQGTFHILLKAMSKAAKWLFRLSQPLGRLGRLIANR